MGGRAVLAKDYNRGRVRLQINEYDELLTPKQARQLAAGYEDSMYDDIDKLQSEMGVERLRRYANEVEPYADDAEE